jgi:DNA end-binding protein Ku
MARPLWKGAISFGLVTVPVGLYSAVEPRGELHFRLLHARDGSPIDYRRFCAEEDAEVPWKEIVKGYEHARGEFVVLTDADFARAEAALPSAHTLEIASFVPRGEIDVRHFDHPYHLAPDGRSAVKAYALLRDALAATGRVGIGKLVLRRREHLAALQPAGPVLVLTTLRHADELRSPEALEVPAEGKGWSRKEMDLARRLIASSEDGWKPGQFTDEYEAVLRDLIARKVKGEKLVVPRRERPAPVGDLMEALKRSLARPRPRLRAIEGGAGRRRRRPRRTAA